MSSPPAPAVVFLHVPKTAGLTLRSVLASQVRAGEVYSQRGGPGDREQSYLQYLRSGGPSPFDARSRADDWHLRALSEIPEPDRARLRLIMGHFWYGVHEALPGPRTYVTVIRDPVRRVLSLHHHRNAQQMLGQGLEEYLDAGRDFEIDNGQTRRVAGPAAAGDDDVRVAPATPDLLEAAKRNLREAFSVVGVTERFDEFVVLLGRTFGWTLRGYFPRNVSRGRLRDEAISPDLRRAIESRNVLDRELHRYAGELQTELKRKAGGDLEDDLRRLRRWSAIYRRARPAVRARNRLRRMRA